MIDLNSFTNKFDIESDQGRFLIKTLKTPQELRSALKLRYKVFQVELIGLEDNDSDDYDQFDLKADHLGIFDKKSGFLVATCRVNHSDFCKNFYSEQEFNLKPMIDNNLKKLEIGRVCVHSDYRKGIIIILLWRAIAKYIEVSKADILFGCGSVNTLEPKDAFLLYRYLSVKNKIKSIDGILPQNSYTSEKFIELLETAHAPLNNEELLKAEALLPPLCRSYFDIGCYVPTIPAFDHEFKCIDFLTVLNMHELDPTVRKKMFGV